MLGYNKKYAVLALNCVLENSKGIISVSKIDRKKNIIKEKKI